MATYYIQGTDGTSTQPSRNVIKFYNSAPININQFDSFLTNNGEVATRNSSGTRLTYRPNRATNQITQFVPNESYEITTFNSFTITTDTSTPSLSYQEPFPISGATTQYVKMPLFCEPISIVSFNSLLGKLVTSNKL